MVSVEIDKMGILFLEFIGLGLSIFVLIVVITQILIPFVLGTPFFPQIRKKTPLKEQVEAAERELEEKTEYVYLKEELNEINRRKAQLDKE
jgi:hypothetical protein